VEFYGVEKCARKGIPLLVANHAQSTFGADKNQATLIEERDAAGEARLPRIGKLTLVRALVHEIIQWQSPPVWRFRKTAKSERLLAGSQCV